MNKDNTLLDVGQKRFVVFTCILCMLIPFSFALEGFSSPQASVSLGDSLVVSDSVVFSSGFVSDDGQNWEPFSFSGRTRGNWIVGQASSTVRTNANYYAVYSCSWSSGWRCSDAWQVYDTTTQQVLVQGGQPRADIVVASDAPNMVKLAADYFQSDIQEMSGALLPIRSAPGTDYDFHVYIGQSQYTDDLGITADGTEFDGYKIVSGNNYLVMLGDDEPYDYDIELSDEEWAEQIAPNTWLNPLPGRRERHRDLNIHHQDSRGSMNAVHSFLYDQGMRWYYPNHYGTITPEKQDIIFSPYQKTVNSPFNLRDFGFYFKDFGHIDNEARYPDDHPIDPGNAWLRWQLSLGENNMMPFFQKYSHGIDTIIGHPETKINHPEYYAIWGETRRNGEHYKPDLCSEGLKQEAIEYVKAVIDIYDMQYVNVMPTDGFTHASSSSPECKAKETPERGREGVLSDYVWNFINDVAWAIADDPEYGQEYIVLGGAYSTYRLPPTQFDDPRGAAPNLAARLSVDRTHYASPELWQKRKEIIQEWNDIIPGNLFMNDKMIRNYEIRKGTASIPYYRPHLISEDFKFLEGISIGGRHETPTTRREGTYDAFATQGLNVYVASKMYWDPSTEIEPLLSEYLADMYGPAQEIMRELVEYSQDNHADLHSNPKHLKHMRMLTQQAYQETPNNSDYQRRVELVLNLINSRFLGEEVEIDSCQMLDSPGTTYLLTQDVTSTENCFEIDHQGVTLDCQGHTISSSGEYPVLVDARKSGRGYYFTLRDCNIESAGRAAVRIAYIYNAVIEDTQITAETGRGIWVRSSENSTIRNNQVSADTGMGLYSQFGDAQRVSGTTLQNNLFFSNSADAGRMIGSIGDVIENNTFRSISDYALTMVDPQDSILQNNIISTQTGRTLGITRPVNLTQTGNKIIDEEAQ